MPASADTAAGLELLDVIQLKGVSRFSGCISIQIEGYSGLLFFRDGQIIHAEAGNKVGEEAFYDIVQRSGAPFTLQANVTTTSHTIHRSWQFLLMESQRVLDETRRQTPVPGLPAAGTPALGTPAAGTPAAKEKRADLVDRIRQIPGVVWAALESKDGTHLGGSSDDVMEAQATQLVHLARTVGERLRTGEVIGATVQGQDRNLLLMATKAFHLLILVKGGAQASATESEIRQLLAARR
jgi:predicted regulator of Ras-like GTPase activity (Roadblock/LC7/MglB family)